MEASQEQPTQEQAAAPAEGESADGTPVAVGESGALSEQTPIGPEDEHGTTTPRSAPPVGPQSGIEPATGQPTVPPGAVGPGEGGV